MKKLKFIVTKVLETAGINGKAALVLKIIAAICGIGAWAADSILDDAKTERIIEKQVTEKLAELIEKGVINVTVNK